MSEPAMQDPNRIDAASTCRNLTVSALIEAVIRRCEGQLARNGALVVQTGKFTGRSPGDKYIVEEPASQRNIWWGTANQPLPEASFDRLYRRCLEYLGDRQVFAQDLYGGADRRYRLPVHLITEFAWHSLFGRQLFVRPDTFSRPGNEEEQCRETRDESGLGSEPQATFSACFGQPFLPLHPARYARLLGEKLVRHPASVWLVNTGWTGGPYGVGHRMNIAHTRAMLDAALEGALEDGEFRHDYRFGFRVPLRVKGVPSEMLDPCHTWSDRAAYDRQARELARLFTDNFKRYEAEATPEVIAAAPRRD